MLAIKLKRSVAIDRLPVEKFAPTHALSSTEAVPVGSSAGQVIGVGTPVSHREISLAPESNSGCVTWAFCGPVFGWPGSWVTMWTNS